MVVPKPWMILLAEFTGLAATLLAEAGEVIEQGAVLLQRMTYRCIEPGIRNKVIGTTVILSPSYGSSLNCSFIFPPLPARCTSVKNPMEA
jgi:hypothetical protein